MMEFITRWTDWINEILQCSYEPDFIVNCVDFTLIHTQQEDKMDCGPACVRMVHKWATGGFDTARVDIDLFADHGEPCWSIELLEALIIMEVCEVQFYTTCLGVDAHHHTLDWYAQMGQAADGPGRRTAGGEGDFQRVQALFGRGLEHKWPIINKPLDDYDLIIALTLHGAVAIVLAHNPVLSAHVGKGGITETPSGDSASFFGHYVLTETPSGDSASFFGHYVLIFGFDSRSGEYLVLNPSSPLATVERYPPGVMSKARGHVGTDSDVLLCYPIGSLALTRA